MPIGVLINSSVVVLGGIIGAALGKKLRKNLIEQLPSVFGLSAIAISITLITQLENLTPVILALILGTIIGELLQLEKNLKNCVNKLVMKTGKPEEDKTETIITVFVLFCFSGTGIFGALNEGFTGNSNVLIAKSVMDFFTAIIFGASTGYLVSLIAIPQSIVGLMLYYSAGFVVPMINTSMLNDFKACGGIITLAAGLKVAKIKNMNVINMLFALFIVMILTYIWKMIGF